MPEFVFKKIGILDVCDTTALKRSHNAGVFS